MPIRSNHQLAVELNALLTPEVERSHVQAVEHLSQAHALVVRACELIGPFKAASDEVMHQRFLDADDSDGDDTNDDVTEALLWKTPYGRAIELLAAIQELSEIAN